MTLTTNFREEKSFPNPFSVFVVTLRWMVKSNKGSSSLHKIIKVTFLDQHQPQTQSFQQYLLVDNVTYFSLNNVDFFVQHIPYLKILTQ